MAHTCSASSLRFNSLIFSPNSNPSSVSDSHSLSLHPSRSRYSIFVFSVIFFFFAKDFYFILLLFFKFEAQVSLVVWICELLVYLIIYLFYFFGAYWCSIRIRFALGSVCFPRKCLQIVMNLKNLRTIRGCGAEGTNQILVLA